MNKYQNKLFRVSFKHNSFKTDFLQNNSEEISIADLSNIKSLVLLNVIKTMDNSCAAITRKGTQCKFSHVDNRVYCGMHLKKCSEFIKEYHDICDKIWDEKCTTDMTVAELDNIIRLASMCVYARIRYSNECRGGKNDEGHQGAILKVQNLIDRCKMIKLVGIKFGNQNPNGKRQYKKHETYEKIIKIYEDMENEMKQQENEMKQQENEMEQQENEMEQQKIKNSGLS